MSPEKLKEQIDHLSTAKQQLLKKLLEGKQVSTVLPAGPIELNRSRYPLSSSQRRLWFLYRLDPDIPIYTVIRAFRLTGPLSVPALKKSLAGIVARHGILRSSFVEHDGEPVQIISDSVDLPFREISLVDGSNGREQDLSKLLVSEARTPFHLSENDAARFLLITTGRDEHVLVLSLHHIVCDDWSVGILLRELSQLYQAFGAGQQSPLPVLPLQFGDFAAWQEEQADGPAFASQLKYWKNKLAGYAATPLIPDVQRPAKHTYEGSKLSVPAPEDQLALIRRFCQEHGCTLFQVLLSAFHVFLAKHTGSTDTATGTVISLRNQKKTEPVIGFFTNTLMVRERISPDLDFRQVLQQIRDTLFEVHKNGDLPFEYLLREIYSGRNGVNDLPFQVMFTLQNTHKEQLSLPGIEAQVLPVDSGTSVFDLTFVMEEKDDRLTITVQYSTCLFHRNTVERLVRNYQQLTRNLLLNPAKPVREVSLMTPEEEREVQSWEGKEVEYPREKSVGEVFEEVVREYGEKVAVVYEGEEVRYEELNRRANQVGRYLRKRGVRRETRVGVCMGRSVEMIVVLVGIVKAGGAYVPLDGSNPRERLRYMMKDGGVEVLVVGEEEEGRVEEGEYEKVVWEREREEMEREGVENLEGGGGGGGEELLYIMYTSGSTGEPKGVGVRHQGVVRLVRNSEYVELGSGEVILQYAPVTFDAATFEIWGALLNGGKLKVFPRYRATVEELREWVEKEGVTTLWLTAGLFHQMVEGGEWPRSMRKVRQLLAGGDVLSGKHVRKFLRESEGCRLINGYGPTENTTFSACGQVERVEEGERVPLGRPIGNSQVYVLDEEMRRVGVGEEGELYLGGDGLARGYWERPEQTAERFVPNPYGKRGGERLYRSGDMGRWREDGQLEFGGRKDQQVKLRGYRIELEEIEEVLKKREWVKEAVVVMRGEVEEEKRLVAYVVREGGKGGKVGEGGEIGEGERRGWEELRKYAGERLPEYMVPGQYVELEEMPLTGNGKIDRKRLREGTEEEEEGRRQRGGGGEGPRTVTETLLAGIWSEVLQVEGVGVEDDFFQLGGHSLLATQIISRIRDTFGHALPLRSIFEKPVLADLALLIDNRQGQGERLPPMLPMSRHQDLPVSFQQEWLWNFQNSHPAATTYNMPLSLLLEGGLNGSALTLALQEVVRRHEILRTVYSMRDGNPLQRVQPDWSIPLLLFDLTEQTRGQENHEALREAALAETQRPFDLTREFSLRGVLFRLAEQKHILFLVWHHIAQDAWSKKIFVEELGVLYNTFLRGENPTLPEVPFQYCDYAAWQRSWMEGAALEQHLSYWTKKLMGAQTALAWPAELRLEQAGAPGGNYIWFKLTFDQLQSLRKLGREQNATLFMVLFTAFVILLNKYTGQSDILVGTDIAHRNRPEIQRTIGFFLNTLVLRTDLEGDPSLGDLLRQVRSVVLEAHDHEDMPFEKLMEGVAPATSSSAQMFSVMFTFQSFVSAKPAFSELEAGYFYVEGTSDASVKFDLELFASEREDGLQCGLGYRTDLFAPAVISMMVRGFQSLAEQIPTGLERRVSELELPWPR